MDMFVLYSHQCVIIYIRKPIYSRHHRGWNVKWQIGLGVDFSYRARVGAADNAILLYCIYSRGVLYLRRCGKYV